MGKSAKDKGKAKAGGTIALNKRARHDYHLEDRYEAGLALQGWELKAIRAGRLTPRRSADRCQGPSRTRYAFPAP